MYNQLFISIYSDSLEIVLLTIMFNTFVNDRPRRARTINWSVFKHSVSLPAITAGQHEKHTDTVGRDRKHN